MVYCCNPWMNSRKENVVSPAGNWTPVSRVTGGDTNHYTTEDYIHGSGPYTLAQTAEFVYGVFLITPWRSGHLSLATGELTLSLHSSRYHLPYTASVFLGHSQKEDIKGLPHLPMQGLRKEATSEKQGQRDLLDLALPLLVHKSFPLIPLVWSSGNVRHQKMQPASQPAMYYQCQR